MKIKPIIIKPERKGRIPVAPPSQEFDDKSKYKRRKKHKKEDKEKWEQ